MIHYDVYHLILTAVVFLVTGNWPPSEFQSEELSLTASFLEACSMIDWAGDVKREQAFVINAAMDTGLMEVKVYNPEAPDRFWADNKRLEQVVLEYRRVGDLSWRSAKLANGSDLDFANEESTYGYAKLNWHVAAIPDGNYEIRTTTHCTPAGLDPPEGINQARSTVIVGLVDRVPPKMFSHGAEPSDGVFNAGDTIAVELTEDIDCSRPFSFNVVVALGSRMIVRTNALDIVCEGRMLEISLVNRFSASTLAGSSVNVTVSGVRDLAQNVMSDELTWAFVFEEDATALPANVVLDGVRFNIPYNTSWNDTASDAYQSFVLLLQQELAAALEVDAARIQIARLVESSDGQTLATIVLTPPSSGQASRRRAANSDASSEELAFLFLSLFGDNETSTGNESSSTGLFGNSSVLSSMDTSSSPSQRVEQAAQSMVTTTASSVGVVDQASTADDDSKTMATVALVFDIVLVVQACIVLWLMSASRLMGLISRYIKNHPVAAIGKEEVSHVKLAPTQPGRTSAWGIAEIDLDSFEYTEEDSKLGDSTRLAGVVEHSDTDEL